MLGSRTALFTRPARYLPLVLLVAGVPLAASGVLALQVVGTLLLGASLLVPLGLRGWGAPAPDVPAPKEQASAEDVAREAVGTNGGASDGHATRRGIDGRGWRETAEEATMDGSARDRPGQAP
jgi:hypothetical protein